MIGKKKHALHESTKNFLSYEWEITVKFQFDSATNSNLSGSVSQKLTLLFCITTTITPLRANIAQIQIIPHYPLTKRAKCDIINL